MNADLFWKKVDKSGECWLWMGTRRSKDPARAYGMVYADGRTQPASRVAWELTHGVPFPTGMEAMHVCDNPPCVRPDHIRVGTHAENMADMSRKGRVSRMPGVSHPQRRGRLTPEQIVAVREATGKTRDIAARFGIVPRHVRSIRKGERWGTTS